MASPQLIKSGPERQINQAPGQNNSQLSPDITVLSDGRFLVVFRDFEGTFDIGGQFLNADGTLSGPTMVLGSTIDQIGLAAGNQVTPAVAQRPGGSAVVVWADNNVGNGDIEVTVLDAAGNETTPGTELNVITGTTGAANQQSQPDVATFSDGRSFIVWNSGPGGDIHARILNAAGTGFAPGDRLDIDSGAALQQSPAVAAFGLNALTVYQDATLGGDTSPDIVARLFNGATDSFGTEFVIANKTAALQAPAIAALPDNRFVIVYTDNVDIFGKIYDPDTPDGAFLSEEFQIDQAANGFDAFAPDVAATIDGGFVVTWEHDVGGLNIFDIFQRRYDAHGLAYGDDFIVNTLRDGEQFRPVVATSGANVLTMWADDGTVGRADTAPNGIRGQAFTGTAFDYNSAQSGDFDNNGRDDILLQNDTGDLTLLRTNSSAVLSSIDSIGSLPAGFRVEGVGNFNSGPGDDILLRSPTQVAVLPMNGITAQPLQVLGGTSAVFVNAGNGDMTGDGQSDLLFRHVNNGQIVSWGVANNALSAPPTVLGSTAPQFKIVALADFTGDGQSDILFRNETNGEIAIWRIANNALAGAPAVVGSTSTSFHVVATGDFDGNNSNDILFRNESGQLAMWLLNSQGQLLGAPVAIGTAPLDFHVEGTGDMNGDNRSDIIFRNANGQIVEWLMNGANFAAPPAVLTTIQVDHAVATHHFDLV